MAEYAARGRVWEGPQDRVWDDAIDLYMTDVARGRSSLLLAGTNEEAAQLARMVRDRRIERGQISGHREVTLRDGNAAGVGDLVRARQNAHIDAAGRRLTNRDPLRLRAFIGEGDNRRAVAEREISPGQWSAPFEVPVSYLAEHAELGYAGTIYSGQGRTVDVGRLVVSPGMDRESLYVGLTRGRQENTLHVPTGPADPAGLSRAEREAYRAAAVEEAAELAKAGDREGALAVPLTPPEPEGMRERAPWESVLAGVMAKDDPELAALEQMKAAQEFAANTRHLLTLSEAFWWKFSAPQVDEAVRARLSPREYERYRQDPERPALLQALRAHEIGGLRIEETLDAITGRSLEGARSIAAVLHGRLGKEPAPAQGETTTWAERTAEDAPEQSRETARMLDARQAELGRQLAAEPPHWALQAWGMPPAEGALRADWERRAGVVGSYREAAGIVDPAQAIGPVPADQAQLREAFRSSVRALALPDEEALLKAMGRGDLEAAVTQYERAEASAPRDVSPELEAADRQHKAHEAQAQAAREAGDHAAAVNAEILADMQGREVAGLQVADAARREWAEAHSTETAEARQAENELRRRGIAERQQEPEAEPEREPEAPETEGQAPEVESEEAFLDRLHQYVLDLEAGKQAEASEPRPEPQPEPEAQPEPEPEAQPDREAAMAEMHEDLQAIGDHIDELGRQAEAQRERQAEAQRQYLEEPRPRLEAEAQAEASREAPVAEREADAEPELEM